MINPYYDYDTWWNMWYKALCWTLVELLIYWVMCRFLFDIDLWKFITVMLVFDKNLLEIQNGKGSMNDQE